MEEEPIEVILVVKTKSENKYYSVPICNFKQVFSLRSKL